MTRHGFGSLLAVLAFALAHGGAARAQLRGTDAPAPAVHIKPSEVTLPPGAKPGEIRRMIQPFAAWTLICDENLKARTRICNVAQTHVDDAGGLVFSWSLAATRTGAPVFILRAPVAGQVDHQVLLDFGKASPTRIALNTCDATLCIGFLPVTPDIRRRIAGGGDVSVQVPGSAGKPIVLKATFDGLAAAIASIK